MPPTITLSGAASSPNQVRGKGCIVIQYNGIDVTESMIVAVSLRKAKNETKSVVWNESDGGGSRAGKGPS